MPIIIKRPLVFEDIADIWDYIAEDNENNADAFIDLYAQRQGNRRNVFDDLQLFVILQVISFFELVVTYTG